MSVPELRRILLIEDEADIRTVARIALEAVGGFEVLACTSGQEALERCDAFQPDLILMDVMLPGMDGSETFQALRTRSGSSHVPVLFMTARVQAEELESYRRLGALEVIAKPFDPMLLPESIRALWSRHHGKSA